MSQFEKFLIRLKRYFKNLDRIGKMWYALLFFACILVFSLFSLSVANNKFYTELAAKLQKTTISNTVSRGAISSSEESIAGTIAVSTDLGTLAVDPVQSGSLVKLLDMLGTAVMNEFCAQGTHTECVQKIATYVRDETIVSAPNTTKEQLTERVKNYLQERMFSPIESVLLMENLSDETVKKINDLNDPSLYFSLNNLYVNPTKVKNEENLTQILSEILAKKPEEIAPSLKIRPKRYLEVIRKMSVSTRDFVKDTLEKNRKVTAEAIKAARAQFSGTKEQEAAIKTVIAENAIYPFVTITPNPVRFYPEGDSMGQITGYVDSSGVGRYGVEGYFESLLQGEAPTQVITKDINGRPIRDYTSTGAFVMKNGVDLTLTIDRNIQKEISKILARNVKNFRANRGSVVVTDPKTGAILAMVNYPTYDPNRFSAVGELEPVSYQDYKNPAYDLFGYPMFVMDSENGTIPYNIDGKLIKLRSATDDEIQNFAIQKFKYKNGFGAGNYQNSVISALYEPGSVFKAITVAIGLDTGEIKPTQSYFDRNSVTIEYGGGAKTVINNYSKARCGGWHTYTSALNWSCNVGMIDIVEKVGRSLFDSYVRNFGFSAKTNVAMDGEVFSQISPYEKWSRAQFFTMSFGQGVSVTMLQMAAAYNALANGGLYMQPYIVEKMVYPNGKVIQTVPVPLRRVISEETSKTITAMLVDGAKNGYAASGAVPGYSMAGKTGTSQIPYKGTYENLYFNMVVGHTVTSYGGYAPAYNPKFVMIVMLERPRTSGDSEKTASVLYREIAEYLLTYYKVPKWQE